MYDELVKDLREISGNRAIPICMAETAKQAADAIEELSRKYIEERNAAVELTGELASKLQWIPVTERLPKADEYDVRGYAVPYLVMNGWMRVTARRTKDYWVLFGEGKVLEYVTNWMPLPEPPKEEET